MKKTLIFILSVIAANALADNLSIEDFTMNVGEQRQVAVMLDNPERAYAALQFDLVLPEGISLAKDEKGKFMASLNTDLNRDHTLSVSKKGEQTYRFMSFSMTNEAFSGTTGALIYVTLEGMTEDLSTPLTGTIASQILTEPDGTQHKQADTTFGISRTELHKCATPTITFVDGNLNIACETEGVKYVYKIVPLSAMSGENENGDITLPSAYEIAVYATKDGFQPSDTATKEIDISGADGMRGDVNNDGKVSMQDAMFIVNRVLDGKFPDE